MSDTTIPPRLPVKPMSDAEAARIIAELKKCDQQMQVALGLKPQTQDVSGEGKAASAGLAKLTGGHPKKMSDAQAARVSSELKQYDRDMTKALGFPPKPVAGK